MKYETTARFDNDFKGLRREHRQQFLGLLVDFNAACEAYVVDPGEFTWPTRLRVRRMTSVRGVWELTWSFASPDGRATFEFVTLAGEVRVRWRRIGDHRVFAAP